MAQNVIVTLGVNARGFNSGLAQAKSGIRQWASDIGKSFAGQYIGATAFVGLLSSLKNFVTESMKLGDDIKDMAELFGGSTSMVQGIKFDAEDAGTSIEKLQKTMGQLAKAREDALSGDSEKQGAFAFFGIALSELQTMDKTIDILARVRESVAALGTDAASSAELLTKMASVGFKPGMLEFLRTPANMNQAGVMSEDQVRKFDELNRQKNQAVRSFSGFGRDMLEGLVEGPAIGANGGTKVPWDELLTLGFSRQFKSRGRKRSAFSKLLGFEDAEPTPYNMQFFEANSDRDKSESRKAKALKELEEADFESLLDEHYLAIAQDINKSYGKVVNATTKQALMTGDIQSSRQLDSMAAMGAFVGGAALSNPALRIQEDQLSVQRSMDNKLNEIAMNTRGESTWV